MRYLPLIILVAAAYLAGAKFPMFAQKIGIV